MRRSWGLFVVPFVVIVSLAAASASLADGITNSGDDLRTGWYPNAKITPDPEIEEFMEQEIHRAPKDPELLAQRLRNNTAASPMDAGGDIDASWEDVNDSGEESVAGDNPTPDQSDVEENAHAVGVNFEDNQELDLFEQLERRDRDRFELDPRSKTEDDTI